MGEATRAEKVTLNLAIITAALTFLSLHWWRPNSAACLNDDK